MSCSSDSCGWIAAIVSCVSFGSFGVPIKGKAATRVDIDPLVMQSYKTIMCFLTSWVVLLLGEDLTYTPWGIVSGIAWVPSGTAAIYAIKNAGLAVAQGTWSALIVLVSFTWGIFIFGEGVKSKAGACFGVFLMMVGLWGMSYYSSPEENNARCYEGVEHFEVPEEEEQSDAFADEGASVSSETSETTGSIEISPGHEPVHDSSLSIAPNPLPSTSPTQKSEFVQIWGCKWSRRRLGLASACFNGLWGGSIMVPMHFSPGNTAGLGYVISFAIGSSVVLLFMWMGRICYHLVRTGSLSAAYTSLPSFHLRVMWFPGSIAGALWSLGNICSMISVEYLGEGVGYSVTQASMLVSGLWGIFWFEEVLWAASRAKWLVAALFTIAGILLLSYEHRNGS